MAPHWKCGSGQPVAGSNPALSAIAVPLVPRAGSAAFPALCPPHRASGPDDAAVSCLMFRRGAQPGGPAGRKPTPRLTLVPRWTTTRQECQRRSPGRRRFSAQARQASVRQPGRRPGMRAKRGIAPAFGGRSIKRALAGFPPPNARFAGARRNVRRSAARRRGRSPAPAPGTDPRPADGPPRAGLRSPPRAIRDRLDPPC